MDEAAVQNSRRHAHVLHRAVLDVQQDGKKHLDPVVGHPVSIPVEHLGRRPERLGDGRGGRQGAPDDLDRRFPPRPQPRLSGVLPAGDPEHPLPVLREGRAKEIRLLRTLERPAVAAGNLPHAPSFAGNRGPRLSISIPKNHERTGSLSAIIGDMDFAEARAALHRLRDNVSSVLLGKREAVELALSSFLAGGHVLLEDLPGTGKTTLARAVAASISGTFRRVQFTSDLLPQDVLGVHIFDADKRSFTFSPGPLFANVVLADEINRSNPRAQSALLEGMSERQVTVDNRTYPLPDPFLVIATQNPFDQHGTYPLPESQLDRFNLRLRLSYPDRESELRLIRENNLFTSLDGVPAVLPSERIRECRSLSNRVTVRDPVVSYIHRIADATRTHPAVRLGASPRGAIGLKSTSQALAFLSGRDHVVPGDVKRAAPAVLCHRIFLKGSPGGEAVTEAAAAVLCEILEALPPPV